MTALFSLSWCFPFSRVLLKEGDSCSAGQEISHLLLNPKLVVFTRALLKPCVTSYNMLNFYGEDDEVLSGYQPGQMVEL
jgi:hypothetical protein